MNVKKKIFCRICYTKIHRRILDLKGMPIAAQHFLKKTEINKKDKSLNLNILQCNKCGLVQLNIRPVSYYKSVITAASVSGEAKKTKLKQLKKFCNKFSLKNKKILEIGSGSGVVLDLIQNSGMKAYGIEYSQKSVLKGKANKRNIFKGYITDQKKIKNSPYDGFICFNFIEHIPKLNLFLKTIYENLNKKAFGLITVPNLNYLIKTKSFYEFVPDHLSYFTLDTIKYLFLKNYFKIIEYKLINNNNDILLTVKKNENKNNFKIKIKPKLLNLKKDYKKVELLINKLKNLEKSYFKSNKKIAVWGAGHRTLALLALSKFKKIDYIIDSAKFKQGLFSPINKTKIVGPHYLQKNPVDLLIVMLPGIYPNEVIKKVQKLKIRGLKLAKLINNKIIYVK